MGNGMNKILPGLFLGNFIDAKDLDQLSRHNITHIVSIHESAQPFIPGIIYLRIALPDTPEANILAGISRSSTIVLAYVMAVTQLNWHDALEAVKAARPVANPNPGFRRQLEEYGGSRSVKKIHRRLERKYGASPFSDEEDIRALLPPGKRHLVPRGDGTPQTLVPKGRGAKHTDPFLLRMKQTFSCLPGCLK
ncbi:dual specificity protein phosphatase 15 isoform X3 [Zootoca vivipara]|uniref:dual specificity protein phosphatase 15 isoform X3 n=1 Tax=Zootoca vivipara TaxID=8524 RepID=UPI00158FCA92|nr:dual specificity protein phosphatase 15 isoform X3 [Zootoca vivipara]